ncbi:MAG: hypothetical protein NC898_03010 [Candidatus Omnitrophica bacterium]|nr:hypothetical protein [Candidatus Omnitrophota bacterium]MCM8793419.1 hypothetical protein [Candidatus Omnitrophota bacterium]
MFLNLADFVIEISEIEEIFSPFTLFQVKDNSMKPDIFIFPNKEYHRFILQRDELRAKGGEDWRIYLFQRRIIFADNFNSGRIIIFDKEIKKGEFYSGKGKGENSRNPLTYPLGPLILSHKLAQKGEGLFLHSGGVLENNSGFILAGSPESGKSTLVELWKKENPKVNVLHDERLILRKREGGFYAYGCPWHLRKVNLVSNQKAKIKIIFFLRQSKKNFLRGLERKESFLRILQHSFYPAYDAKLTENSLDFLRDLIEKIPCFELGFKPTSSVITFLRKHIDR